jgi:hypothetical protein
MVAGLGKPKVIAFVCGGDCIVRLFGQLTSQGEMTMGPLLRL